MLTYNGTDLSNLITVNDITGRGPFEQESTLQDVPGRNGSYFVRRRRKARTIGIKLTLIGDSMADRRSKVNQLNGLLNVSEPKAIVFDDEPGMTYFGILDGKSDWSEIVKFGQGQIHFTCPDPDKLGSDQTKDFSNDSVTVTNNGNTETFPVMTITFTSSASEFKVTNQDGQSIRVVYNFVDNDVLVLDFTKRKVTINGNTHMTALDWANSEWFSLTSGDHTIDATPTAVAAETISYTERWL